MSCRMHYGPAVAVALVYLLMLSDVIPAPAAQQLQTGRIEVHGDHPGDLELMAQRLRFPGSRLRVTAASAAVPVQGLAAHLDAMLARVCQILNRRPAGDRRLRIFLLKDGRQVRERYLLFQPPGQAPLFGHPPLEAFYERQSQSIFLSLSDLHPGILAHELAHFVLASTRPLPPPQMQEEWARYVENRW